MSKYKQLDADALTSHFDSFLISSWSFSKVNTFQRNEKEFERCYIYNEEIRKSATAVAGSAYHEALAFFFNEYKDGKIADIITLECIAYAYIQNIKANQWQTQETTPTIDDCIEKSIKSVNTLLRNFYAEKEIYIDEIDEILGVEQYYSEWLTINGVEIPLPCNAIVDLAVKTKDGKMVIIDHKSKSVFTDEKELYYTGAKQAITYAKCYESQSAAKVDEVWFIENKIPQNKDKSNQLIKFPVKLDADTTQLYEALLYEPLRRMVMAVQDPDYVYMINDADNYVDTVELYNFWAKTMISEVEEFNIDDTKKEIVSKRLKKIRDASIANINPSIIKNFVANAQKFIPYQFYNQDMTNKEKIEHVLRSFGVIAEVSHEIEGYSSISYLLTVGAGQKIGNISKFKLDIANALNVDNVRIGQTLSVYNGRSYLHIELSKKSEKILIFEPKDLEEVKIPIGKNNYNETIIWNLANPATPHALICGSTGSGKSVSIRSTIEYAKLAGVKDIMLFDPKHEFVGLANKNIKVYNDIEDIERQMEMLVKEMQGRVRKGESRYKLVIFDEFADAISQSKKGKALNIYEEKVDKTIKMNAKGGVSVTEKRKNILIGKRNSLEENLKMLLQKGRSAGYRVLAATQRASVQVVTGDAKVNFPVQICFKVPKDIDSKVVLGEDGAELLLGKGDGLIRSPEYGDTVRFQGYFYK